ncbi:MAG TPA: FUSC family protein [Polyangia bacterium]|nr:FUSC family protein [Polyangia bacterium]
MALLAAGVATGHTRPGIVAAAGAFSVGFGAFREIRGSRLLPMLLAAFGMCASSWIGTFAGASGGAAIAAIALAGIGYSALWRRGAGPSWVALQCVVWLVISTAYHDTGLRALARGAFALCGGLLQIAVVSLCRRLSGAGSQTRPAAGRPPDDGRRSRAELALEAARAAVDLAAAALLWRALAIPNGYWIPMTAAIVMQTDFRETLDRAGTRLIGTLIGAAVATGIAAGLRPQPSVLVVLASAFAAGSTLLVSVNYAAFVVCLTSYVVFLLSLAGLPEPALVVHRAVSTVVGGAIAVLTHAAVLPLERAARRAND